MTTSESKGRFFTKHIDAHNESIRIANWNALILGCSGICCSIVMLTVCTLLESDNHTNTSSLNLFMSQMLFLTLS